MMDIEKLQKINMLAKELVQHGICKTMDEAYRQAGKSIETTNPLVINEMQTEESSAEMHDEETTHPSFQKSVYAQATSNGIVQTTTLMPSAAQQITQHSPIVEKQPLTALNGHSNGTSIFEFRKLQEQVTTLEKQVNYLNTKMGELVSELNRMKQQKQTPPPLMSTPPKQEERTQHIPQQTKTPDAHPRSGEYKPGDVAIEKMFYFGGGGRR